MRSCSACGHQAPADDSSFCSRCGASIQDEGVYPTQTSSKKKQKVLIAIVIALAVIAAITAGIVIFFALGEDQTSGEAILDLQGLTVASEDYEVVEEDLLLKEPFTLRVASLDGTLPDDLVDFKVLLEQVTIKVNNGVVSGSASQPATASDGSVIPGQNKTLEISGRYEMGLLMATWTYFRPYGAINVNGGGYIDSRGRLTKEDASCSLKGTYNRAWSDGRVETQKVNEITIRLAVSN